MVAFKEGPLTFLLVVLCPQPLKDSEVKSLEKALKGFMKDSKVLMLEKKVRIGGAQPRWRLKCSNLSSFILCVCVCAGKHVCDSLCRCVCIQECCVHVSGLCVQCNGSVATGASDLTV